MVDAGGVVIWLGSAREDLVRGTVETQDQTQEQEQEQKQKQKQEWEQQQQEEEYSDGLEYDNGVYGEVSENDYYF